MTGWRRARSGRRDEKHLIDLLAGRRSYQVLALGLLLALDVWTGVTIAAALIRHSGHASAVFWTTIALLTLIFFAVPGALLRLLNRGWLTRSPDSS